MIDKQTEQRIRTIYDKIVPDTVPIFGTCLFWSIAVIIALGKKERCLMQASTCLWPRINMAEDDGIVLTHFGYEWHPESINNQLKMNQGMMPELHTWVGLPDKQRIIDFSTVFFPEQCKKLIGLDWTGPLPPQYLDVSIQKLPDYVVYKASMDACLFADTMAAAYMSTF